MMVMVVVVEDDEIDDIQYIEKVTNLNLPKILQFLLFGGWLM